MIRDLGHQVREASGGLEALTILAEGGDFDVVVTDYKMPGMDGAELADKIHEIRPDTGILLITGYTGAREEVLHLPRLAKPFGQAGIASALARFSGPDANILRFPRGRRPGAA